MANFSIFRHLFKAVRPGFIYIIVVLNWAFSLTKIVIRLSLFLNCKAVWPHSAITGIHESSHLVILTERNAHGMALLQELWINPRSYVSHCSVCIQSVRLVWLHTSLMTWPLTSGDRILVPKTFVLPVWWFNCWRNWFVLKLSEFNN